MPILFETTKINGIDLANRFIRSAACEWMAERDGTCTQRLIDTMVQLAAGGVGLIITGHVYVQKSGRASPWQLGIYDDALITGLREMAQAVHNKAGRIFVQLAHAGPHADPKLTGETPHAPSVVKGRTHSTCREMTQKDIRDLIEAFGLAAKRAKSAGYDGVQIHAAHGYLLSQFLSPAFNKRADRYGGSVENRVRILLEVLQSIRKHVGRDYPVTVKINCRDFIEDGLELEDSLKAGMMLKEEGIDAIELSGGIRETCRLNPSRTGILSEKDEAYFREEARAFKESINLPLILVGGIRSFHLAERLVKTGTADYISMSRPFIREPDLINRWKSGDLRRAACISDNKCKPDRINGQGLYCVTQKSSLPH